VLLSYKNGCQLYKNDVSPNLNFLTFLLNFTKNATFFPQNFQQNSAVQNLTQILQREIELFLREERQAEGKKDMARSKIAFLKYRKGPKTSFTSHPKTTHKHTKPNRQNR
jgi:hypothetical protein